MRFPSLSDEGAPAIISDASQFPIILVELRIEHAVR
jgi:hypothetical protein